MDFIYHQVEVLIAFILGLIGAGTRVIIAKDREEKHSKWKTFATLICGSVLAATSTNATIVYMDMPAISAGAISFFIGLFGLGFVYRVLDGKIAIPFINKALEK